MDIAPPISAAQIIITISQKRMIAGRKQQATMKAAAIHLNMILRTDPKGISKSTIEIRCEYCEDRLVVAWEERQGL